MVNLCLIVLFDRYKNQIVVVKVIHKGEIPEEIAKREGQFSIKVAMLSRVKHKNLMKGRFSSI